MSIISEYFDSANSPVVAGNIFVREDPDDEEDEEDEEEDDSDDNEDDEAGDEDDDGEGYSE